MNRIFKTFIIVYTLFMALAGWGFAWLETGVFGLKDLGIYPLFPAFFWIWGIILMITVNNISKTKPIKVLNIYMLFKIAKNMFAGAIAIYVFLNVTEKREYMLMGFGFFYIVSLVTETLFIYKTEQNNKKLKNQS
jgi:hypothetical protein